MIKSIFKILSIILLLVLSLSILVSCESNNSGEVDPEKKQDPETKQDGDKKDPEEGKKEEGNKDPEPKTDPDPLVHTDYSTSVKLDMESETAKAEVTVKIFIDGDTTHFRVPTDVVSNGVLKARYLAINTPESTGKIEEYGKKASNYTKTQLSKATSIYIESDDENWNVDSTGSRYLVWVWYKTEEDTEYRNLNIEILQNGLAIASNSAQNRYGSTCIAAINQAKAEKLNVYSGKQDPDFYYGGAVSITLKELRYNVEEYNGIKVAFEANIYRNYNNGVYLEEYDEETETYFGFYAYYGTTASGGVLSQIKPGYRAKVVGTISEFQGAYQIAGLQYDIWGEEDSCEKISEGYTAAYTLTTALDFTTRKVSAEFVVENELGEEELKTMEIPYAEAVLNSSISMENLYVDSVYTTDSDEESSSYGALTLTCKVGNITISVRTVVLKDEGGNTITADCYEGKTINVKGIVDCYNGSYQIKVFNASDITIND